MTVSYTNVYEDGSMSTYPHPQAWSAKINADPGLVRVDMAFNGFWHRPPVGMRADHASHIWALDIDRNDKAWVMILIPNGA